MQHLMNQKLKKKKKNSTHKTYKVRSAIPRQAKNKVAELNKVDEISAFSYIS